MLLEALKTQLANGLLRKSATTCSKWAEQYVVLGKPIPGPMSFRHHPWSREWHNCDSDWTGMKAAQMGMTMSALNRAIFTIDIKRNDVLYVLPKKTPDAADFSKAKFDTLLELSPYLSSLFNNVKNIGHKQSGAVNFYLRGSRSRSGLKSISVGLRIYDEFDEMNQNNISLADERSSGYLEKDKQNIRITTPTIPEYGVSKEWETTTQEHFFFKCPNCSKLTEFVFPDDLIITSDSLNNEADLRKSYVICHECKSPISQEQKATILARGIWNSTANPKAYVRGFYVNQLYSLTIQPWEIAKLGLKARTEGIDEQEYWNSKGGLPHALAGARLDDQHINACKSSHRLTDAIRPGLITMGVDVGHKVLYYWIDRWLLPPEIGPEINQTAVPQTLMMGVVPGFESLDPLMYNYQVNHAVVDTDPDFRGASNFATRHAGTVSLCRFVRGQKKRSMGTNKEEGQTIHVNRTYWLDNSQSRFLSPARIILPLDMPEEINRHLKALTRHTSRDPSDGNIVSRYISTSADHFAFARVYSEIALPLAVSVSESKDVESVL